MSQTQLPVCPVKESFALQVASKLTPAWHSVRKAGGAPGIDGESLKGFELVSVASLNELRQRVEANRYGFSRLRSVDMKKENGEFRKLGIPTVRDRIVLQGMNQALGQDVDRRLLNCCHAYRHGRGVGTAIDAIGKAMRDGRFHIVETDIRRFFDSIPHRWICQQIDQIRPRVSASRLFRRALKLSHRFWASKCGVAQGSPLSPLLANATLIEFDRSISGRCVLVRYADDLLMMNHSASAANNVLEQAVRVLSKIGLQLHPGKTRILDGRTDSFEFLGFRFSPDRIGPTEKNLSKLYESIHHWCVPKTRASYNQRIDRINGLLRSFAWYYRQVDCTRILWNLDSEVRSRLSKLRPPRGNRNSVIKSSDLLRIDWCGTPSTKRWNDYG